MLSLQALNYISICNHITETPIKYYIFFILLYITFLGRLLSKHQGIPLLSQNQGQNALVFMNHGSKCLYKYEFVTNINENSLRTI
jgi:hypothetical protein